MPSRILHYLKVVKGECRSKIKMKFFNFDYAEPHPTLFKGSERREKKQTPTFLLVGKS